MRNSHQFKNVHIVVFSAGCESVVAGLNQLVEEAPDDSEVILGMSHRGRLNVLCNVLGTQGSAAEKEQIACLARPLECCVGRGKKNARL